MIAAALRSLAQRKLRTALTAIAVLLGVAMVAGTYVQTDQIRAAFDQILQTANQGVDANIAPRTEFSSQFLSIPAIDERMVQRVARVRGVDRAAGEIYQPGSLVVRGRAVEPQFAPAMVLAMVGPPFNPMKIVSGRFPARSGEIAINRKLAEDNHLAVGAPVGVTSRTGIHPARLVGIADFGDVASMGGATMIIAPRGDVQSWNGLEGKVTSIVAAARSGVSPGELVRNLRAALPHRLEVKTGAQATADTSKQINDSIGAFLKPALLAFSGAALLVGAFIIFNTFSITVAQRRREFALLRALGATRGQVLAGVGAEALVLGVVASVAGLLAGLGFSRLLGTLFDAAGMGIPRAGVGLEPRTIVIGLTVGIGVTAAAAVVPAIRATRVAPVAAMREEAAPEAAAPSRRRTALVALVGALGTALLLHGLFGGGAASARLTTMGVGSMLVFVGVALLARHAVRPLAAVVGWPLARVGHATGELARDNSTRNPARTAVTAATLMVGIGLVAFVAVLAAGLKTSFTGAIGDRSSADLIVSSDTAAPLSRAAGERIQRLPAVSVTAPQYIDQIKVNGQRVHAATDQLNGIDPLALRDVYRFRWIHGSDSELQRLGPGAALVEEQFAKQHRIAVGDRFRLTGPTGRTATMTAIAEYRDPLLMQGVMVDVARFHALSAIEDPLAFYVRLLDGRHATAVEPAVKAAVRPFPAAKVRTLAEYNRWLTSQLDRIVYLLYALLAMSVVISMFGIANSLFLSIHERTRELGMLRAVGATTSQVRRMVRYESVITSLIGGVLGTVVGVAFAWLTTFAIKDLGVGFTLPVGQLLVFVLLATVVGIVGAIAPARGAARLDILEAIHSE
jgi:putative ABC transport system permease protein